jgi:hypothetical protein
MAIRMSIRLSVALLAPSHLRWAGLVSVYRHTFNATNTSPALKKRARASCATATLQRLGGSLKAEGFGDGFPWLNTYKAVVFCEGG